MAYDCTCMHEFVMSLEKFHKENNVSALDVAKALLDFGIHPPTMYFPLIVSEALMVEPTETESRETLDDAIAAFRKIYDSIINSPASVPLRLLLLQCADWTKLRLRENQF